jgi:hypothetical protein
MCCTHRVRAYEDWAGGVGNHVRTTRSLVDVAARSTRPTDTVPRLALTMGEAAASIGMSRRTFDCRVAPHVAVVRMGKLRLVRPAELERWLRENESRVVV